MKAMLKKVWRGSPVTEFLSRTSRALKSPNQITSRRASTVVPSCIGWDSFV